VFEIGSIRCAAGQAVWGQLPVGAGPDGREIPCPIFLAHGVIAGPTLYVGGGAHGDELNGVEAARLLALSVDPEKLRGTLIVVPVQNVPAYLAFSHQTPWDGRDLVECYPGSATGTPTERMANALFAIMTRCDGVIDLHTAAPWGEEFPLCMVFGKRQDLRAAMGLAEQFALGVIVRVSPGDIEENFGSAYRPNLFPILTARGIPAVLIEAGGGGKLEAPHVERMLLGLQNAMRYLKMVDGDIESLPQPFVTDRLHNIRSSTRGLLKMLVQPGDEVTAGAQIARVIVVPDTEVPIHTTLSGLVLRVTTRGLALPGDRLAVIGTTPQVPAAP
jgi:predicted deacylase